MKNIFQKRAAVILPLLAAACILATLFQPASLATLIGGYNVNVRSVVPGTAGTNEGKAEGGTYTSGDVGVAAQAVRQDTLGSFPGSSGLYGPLQLNARGAEYVQITPNVSGGLLTVRDINVGTGKTVIKNTAGQLYHISVTNTTASTMEYLRLYNAACSAVTVGTTTIVNTIAIPGNTMRDISLPNGQTFSTGICAAATAAVADADTTAPAANAVVANFWYF